VGIPTASASTHGGCPDVEVVFARGTFEPAGIGEVGQAFVDNLRQDTRHNVSVYAVNYPASMDFAGSTADGVSDIVNHVEAMAHNCPGTETVLAGYSQGAAVAGFATSSAIPDGVVTNLRPMSNDVAINRVAAVVMFGTPGPSFMAMIGQPNVAIGHLYQDKTDELCVPDDFICGGGDMGAHGQYISSGLVNQGASFAAARL
jgi:cutinase